MKRVLFIDRDGTLIREPQPDFQVDSLEKLEFMASVFRSLHYIVRNLDYELVMVTNQDGLGTDAFPEEKFNKVQQKMLKTFENEGIVFDDILIDRSLPGDRSPLRKPGTGMLAGYKNAGYDLQKSFVIGDRMTDLELAGNLGSKAILFGSQITKNEVEQAGLGSTCVLITDSWEKIVEMVALGIRSVSWERITNESKVMVELDLDGNGEGHISTGIGFFDHLLSQLARHSGITMHVKVEGDLHVDEHHTIEDTAISIGEAFSMALGEKRGMDRYGFVLPMDDCMAQVLIDFGGRSWLIWNAEFKREKIGEMPTEMFMHFFKSFADGAKCNLQITAGGNNEHHKIEAIFKATARAIKMAIKRDPFEYRLPTTKGML
ncbi:MAG: bifunctional histidinol-phosphatase/imidazoleglycerol-phosphate dehydratase HisB [Bacteroidales bacterium]|nr:bifunctional histidinol-phosphatase/imidazoleglycerol-phosphate dehydratase HisB [Bacteroidales bacterium]